MSILHSESSSNNLFQNKFNETDILSNTHIHKTTSAPVGSTITKSLQKELQGHAQLCQDIYEIDKNPNNITSILKTELDKGAIIIATSWDEDFKKSFKDNAESGFKRFIHEKLSTDVKSLYQFQNN